MFKKFVSIFIVFSMIFSTGLISSQAATFTSSTPFDEETSIIQRGGDADLWRYRKKNVETKEQWSNYKRVSDNASPGAGEYGELSCNREVTFNASVTGGNELAGVSASGSISSSIGYTLGFGPNRSVYMGYRVRNKIETGTWEKYNHITDRVIESK